MRQFLTLLNVTDDRGLHFRSVASVVDIMWLTHPNPVLLASRDMGVSDRFLFCKRVNSRVFFVLDHGLIVTRE